MADAPPLNCRNCELGGHPSWCGCGLKNLSDALRPVVEKMEEKVLYRDPKLSEIDRLRADSARLRAEGAELRRDLAFVRAYNAAVCSVHLASSATAITRASARVAPFERYAGLLNVSAIRRRITRAALAACAGVPEIRVSSVIQCNVPPFDEATTRKLCVLMGCDPEPLLKAARECEEAIK